MRRVYNALRSRRLAVWLIALVMAYAGVATLLPLGPPQDPAVITWASEHPALERVVGPLALHEPFTSPWFALVAILLILSTAACSIERTGQALRLWNVGRFGPTTSVPLPARPTFTVPADSGDSALTGAAASMSTAGVGPRPQDSHTLIATRNLVSAFGSPLFHWALVALFIFAALGQITRSEGDIPVVVGSSRTDQRESYLTGLRTGLLFAGRFTGWNVAVTRVQDSVVAGGVERGSSPYVRITREGRVVAEGLVYPNHPLKSGSVVVHRSELGPAALVTITLPDGTTVKQRPVAFTDPGVPPASASSVLLVSDGVSEAPTQVRLDALARGRMTASVSSADFKSNPFGVGETVRIPGGMAIRVEKLTTFARLTVVNDWSVPFIYAAFILAVIGELFALLLPPRVVVATYRPGSQDLAVWVLRKRVDPAFPSRVARAFDAADIADKRELQ